jgi:hypothetical protein
MAFLKSIIFLGFCITSCLSEAIDIDDGGTGDLIKPSKTHKHA